MKYYRVIMQESGGDFWAYIYIKISPWWKYWKNSLKIVRIAVKGKCELFEFKEGEVINGNSFCCKVLPCEKWRAKEIYNLPL